MLFFGLKLHQCTPTERDHVRNYLTGLNVAMAPYTRGCALTLFPQEIEGCEVGVPENCTVTGPLLARDIRQMTPLPRSVRDHVTVYVSGATEKCQWLYSVLSKITSHRFVVFSPYDESLTCPNLGDNVEIRRVNRAGFLQSMAYSYACVTNAGMQTAAEALYLQVPNYMLPTANHHAQCAVSESVQRANGGETCLRDVKSETKANRSLPVDYRYFWIVTVMGVDGLDSDPDEVGRTLLRAVQERPDGTASRATFAVPMDVRMDFGDANRRLRCRVSPRRCFEDCSHELFSSNCKTYGSRLCDVGPRDLDTLER